MRKRRVLKIAAGTLVLFALAVFLNFLPTFDLRTPGMQVKDGQHVRVFYEGFQEAAAEVFALAEQRGGQLKEVLGVPPASRIEIYLYDHQVRFQLKKYGYITGLLGLSWYIGDNAGDRVLLLSPAGETEEHSYQDILKAVLHEMVHAYNHLVTPKLSYFLDNGIAGLLSEQTPNMYWERMRLPTLKDTQVKGLLAPLQFARYDGYAFSYKYVEYLDKTYGWQKVKDLLHRGRYEEAFGKTQAQVYEDWAAEMVKDLGLRRPSER